MQCAAADDRTDRDGVADPTRALERQAGRGLGTSREVSDLDDPELLQRLQRGDEAAYNTIYFASVAALIRFAYSYLGSTAAAEDVVADTFVHLWDRRATLAPQFGLRAYLFAAVRHRVQHLLRGEGRRARMLGRFALASSDTTTDEPAPETAMDLAVAESKLRRVIESLPTDRRRLVALRWYEDLTVPEIAAVLGLSAGAVKQRLLRTLDTLRKLLDGEQT